jgi:hypothetical protein
MHESTQIDITQNYTDNKIKRQIVRYKLASHDVFVFFFKVFFIKF